MITAPYNFVPLSDKVVSPHWAKLVSHDIPFKDSESGVLELTITAESPIYVRNGSSRDAADGVKNAFNNIDGKYFIPGSSIKGMLRSLLEIMSFGRMGNKVNDHKYSVRDFQNDTIYPKSSLAVNALCGWLYKKNGQYLIDDCGKPGRISHKTLDALCTNGIKISDYYKIARNITPTTKSAKSKYETFSFTKDNKYFTQDPDNVGRPICKIDTNGDPGIIVFSGQPGVRNEPADAKPSGKHLEFVFFQPEYEAVEVEENAMKNFFFAYYNHDISQQKDDWKWRKSQLDKGEKIPVFFRLNEDGSFVDIGLSLLYKITYANSICDVINNHQKDAASFDLAETIFGYTQDKEALKGRVHVGHAFATNKLASMTEVTNVLSGPKASYYPNYIEQNNIEKGSEKIIGEYQTFKDDNVKIRGWKRYPVHAGVVKQNPPPVIKGVVNNNIGSKFTPLPTGTEFRLQINYHNLRKEELGALISAITFHNTAGLFHSIGSGKPLGYGKTSITITNLNDDEKLRLLKDFELYMDFALKNSTQLWFHSVQIKELFAMAKASTIDDKLKYMELNDFVAAKGRSRTDPKNALQKYSDISKNNIDVKPLGTVKDLQDAKDKYDKEIALFNNQQDLKSAMNGIINYQKIALETALAVKKKELINKLNILKQQTLNIANAALGIPAHWHIITDFKILAHQVPNWQIDFPNQIIPDIFQDDLVVLIEIIISKELKLPKKKKDWEGGWETNKNCKCIIAWVGESRAVVLFNKLKL